MSASNVRANRAKAGQAATNAEPKATVTFAAVESVLNDLRGDLYAVMGIVRMACGTVREPPLGERSLMDAWTALDGAYTLLDDLTDRLLDTKKLLSDEVIHGDE